MTKNTRTEDEYDCHFYYGLVLGVILTISLGGIFLGSIGAFDSPINELQLNKDKIARSYTLEYYPEYENCSIEWDSDLKSDCRSCPITPGVNIFCKGISNRDGLRIVRDSIPTEQIEFDDVDINTAFSYLISKYE